MIAAIHQPNFIPWIGYFYKMLKADQFIFLDDVQFNRRGYTARVKIKSINGESWLSVPTQKKGRYLQSVMDVELEQDEKWKKKIIGSFQSFYGRTNFFKTYFPEIESIILKEYQNLSELNIALIHLLARQFNIQTQTIKSSELDGIDGQATDRLISICKAVEADKYLSGFGGQNYQEKEVFEQNGLELIVYDFIHPVYQQQWGDFIAGLSAVDLLFNCGPHSIEIIKNCGSRSLNNGI